MLFRIDKSIFFTVCVVNYHIRGISSFSSKPIPSHHVSFSSRQSGSSKHWPAKPIAGITAPLSMIPNNEVDQNMQSSMYDQDKDTYEDAGSNEKDRIDSTFFPTYRQLFLFTATNVIIWISESLLSLVDTTVVGMRSSSMVSTIIELAALGPATTLYDTEILSTYFLAISTTNQLAPLLAKKKWRELQHRTSELMGLAALLGCVIMIANFVFGKFLIRRMIGSLTEPEIVPLAKEYIWIRSLVTPFVLMGWVAESFCLSAMDTKTPGTAVIVAACLNIVGDLALVPFFGIQGAAVATALAAFVFSVIVIRKVQQTKLEWKENERKDAMEEQSIAASSATEHASPTEIPFLSLPNAKDSFELLRLAGPIFLFTIGNLACYSALKLRAPMFGILSLATHNIMSEIYYFFACFGESVGHATQTFVPQVAEHEQGKLIRKLFSFSTFIAFFNCIGANLALQHFSGCFTNEEGIARLMKQFAPYVGMAALIQPFTTLTEGVLLVQRDMKCLVGMYCTTLIAHFGILVSPCCKNFRGLWQALVLYEGIRVVQFTLRLWQKAKQKKSMGQRTS